MKDIFERIKLAPGALGQYQGNADGYFMFPKLEGEVNPIMRFNGKEVLVWSLNNYMGLANLPEVREADAKAAKEWGLAYPMGSRMMSGDSVYHKKLEQDLADFVHKEAGYLMNFGYQGMLSIIDTLLSRRDVVVYDSESHACIIDGLRLHVGKRFVYRHNDMESLRDQLKSATALAMQQNGGVLVVTEGVFGMAGDLGKLDEIVAMKKEFAFRLLVDDAHGFGTMGDTGAGTPEFFHCQKGIDIYFATFAKAMAGFGAFVASDRAIVDHLRFNMRSQIFAKSLPLPMVFGLIKRLELLKSRLDLRKHLWDIVHALQSGLKEKGLDLGNTQSPVTPVFLQGGPDEGANIVVDLRENYDIFCSVVAYPVVPKGVILLRIIPTAAHRMEDVDRTIEVFGEIKKKLDAGEYEHPMPSKPLLKK